MKWFRLRRTKFRRWRLEVNASSEVVGIAKSAADNLSANPQIFIGPTNSAGQGYNWAAALTAREVLAKSMRIVNTEMEFFVADIGLARLDWAKFANRLNLANRIAGEFSAVLLESLRPIFALKVDNSFKAIHAVQDLKLLKTAGKRVAVVFHGSDIRDMDYHASINPFSPYREAGEEAQVVKARSAETRAVIPLLKRSKIPIFITTPDLFHEVPDATWLPIAINLEPYFEVAKEAPAFAHDGPPRVLYLPSKSWIKSAATIEPILAKLDIAGVIQWIRSEPVSNEELPKLLGACDVLVDQFLGIVGVLPVEAMAAGRIVLTHLEEWAYEKIERPPVTEITPTTLEGILRGLQPNPAQVAAGLAYVGKWHSGEMSARLLSQKLLSNNLDN